MYRLTEEGKQYFKNELPEKRIIFLISKGPVSLKEITELPYAKIGIGWAKKNGWIKIIGGNVEITEKGLNSIGVETELEVALTEINKNGSANEIDLKTLMSRNLVEEIPGQKEEAMPSKKSSLLERLGFVKKREVEIPQHVEKTIIERPSAKEIAQITPDILKGKSWKNIPFKNYDVNAPAPKIFAGKKQPYVRFMQDIRNSLVAMGFREMRGPMVESFFWNCDALFMPQDHPGRSVHDALFVKSMKTEIKDKDLVARVKATHEGGWITESTGWGGTWSEEDASKLLMRSQTTSVSARTLQKHGDVPGKYFTVNRVFRHDVIDVKHLLEFDQCEGIIVGEHLTLRHLLGMLKEFGEMIGVKEIRFKPAYFPYTEPSVEMYMKFPKLGWVEVGGAGMLRPEVLKPLGIEKCQVLAWGLGLGRLAMIKLGINDIRDLYSENLGFLRDSKMV